jgi:hypothetical protein
LTGITKKQLVIRLELPDHAPVTRTIDIPDAMTATAKLALLPLDGRLVIWDLPPNSSVIVDGQEYDAGDPIPVAAGQHDIRIVLDGKIIAQQAVDAGAGDQRWKFVQGKLVRN